MRKNPKALKLVFHGIPAYTIPWTGKWHFASMCNGKKFIIFVQSSWILVKMIASWGNHFQQVLRGLDKKYGFFTKGLFLKVGPFLTQTLLSSNKVGLEFEPNH